VVLVADEMAEENAIARQDVRTTTREERRIFLLVMPTVCFRRSKANRSQASPNPSSKRFIPNQVWIIPTTEGLKLCRRVKGGGGDWLDVVWKSLEAKGR
jgi:hypothetical protein